MRSTPNSLLDLWKPLLVVACPGCSSWQAARSRHGMVFIGIFFGMLFWAGVPWPLLVMLASPGVSLIFAFSTGVWGAWFLVLLALLLWYRPYLAEGVRSWSNVAMGVVAPLLWDKLNPISSAAAGIPRSAVPIRSAPAITCSSRRSTRSAPVAGSARGSRWHAEAARLPAGAAHRLHLRRVGEELGFIGVTSRWRSFSRSSCAARAWRTGQRPVSRSGRLRAGHGLVRARGREHRHDAQPHAHHRHPAAVLQLRRLVPARELAGYRGGALRISAEGRGQADGLGASRAGTRARGRLP
jgi:hypothetical protein